VPFAAATYAICDIPVRTDDRDRIDADDALAIVAPHREKACVHRRRSMHALKRSSIAIAR
jgi:hypothetical protein